MSAMQNFAKYLTALRFEDLPADVVEQAELCLLDGFGNLLGGAAETAEEPYIENILRADSGKKESTVAGHGMASCETAAFLNAVMLRSLDWDDGHRIAMGHPGSTLVPTVLALGEKLGASGKEILTALCVGYETHVRIGSVVNPYSYNKGFEATATIGTIADTAAIAWLRGLDAATTAHAMGIATTFTGALIEYQNDSSSGKVLCAALAALDAMRAIDLATAGFTGPRHILEGPKGFFQAYGPEPAEYALLENPGKPFGIMSVYFKVHACMRGLHAAIDALLAIREREALRLDAVRHVRVRASSFVKRLVQPHPRSASACQSNLLYCLGLALKYGHIDPDNLASGIDDPEIDEFEKKCEFIHDTELDAYVKAHPSHWGVTRIEVATKDGNTFSARKDLANGEPECPLPASVLEEKFAALLSKSRWKDKSDDILSAVRHFREMESVQKLWHIVGA